MLSKQQFTPRAQHPTSTAQDGHVLQPRAHSSNAIGGINNSAIQAVHQRAASGSTSAAHTTSRVHTLSDPATALQPLSREKFLAKLPKVQLKSTRLDAECLHELLGCCAYGVFISLLLRVMQKVNLGQYVVKHLLLSAKVAPHVYVSTDCHQNMLLTNRVFDCALFFT